MNDPATCTHFERRYVTFERENECTGETETHGKNTTKENKMLHKSAIPSLFDPVGKRRNGVQIFVQINVVEGDRLYAALVAAAKDLRFDAQIYPFKYVPFTAIISGRIVFACETVIHKAYAQGAQQDLVGDDFRVSRYLKLNPGKNLNEAVIQTAREFMVSERSDDYVFIRPNLPFKVFPAQVVHDTTDGRQEWVNSGKGNGYALTPNTVIAVSKVQSIKAEFRVFMVDGSVISAVMYRKGPLLASVEIHEGTPLWTKLTDFVTNLSLPNAVCAVDVADTGEDLKVVEFTPVACAGFYGLDPKPFCSAYLSYLKAQHENNGQNQE